MSWLVNISSMLFSKQHTTKDKAGKKFMEIYNEFGAFEYDNSGFKIYYENFIKRIAWTDITQLNVYKIDQFTVDRVDMEIVYGDKAFTISEELPGWYQFIIKTKEIFPTIPKDWDVDIIQPAFATNYRTIYNKEEVNQE